MDESSWNLIIVPTYKISGVASSAPDFKVGTITEAATRTMVVRNAAMETSSIAMESVAASG